ncbi:hypothetical protein [Aestuariirhabdus litorea]|uniref:Elongation factor-1 alpha n=1 Tax=Aestuariirhabdus litorea TaxID=2528527 RepID=A0A3P3VNG1_9GAMM|nr:hypothetical protein [Aestuariirhabdus litorea]RRJ84245.1 hypothetical protein D0544_03810 [Aestuariirhabdus litorea]RWW97467.1 hypothetical protein DZC74_03810 [Endozoicomonadaceae bacterium GTF-13]
MRIDTLNFQARLGLSGFLITVILGALSAATLIGLIYSTNTSGFNVPDMDKVKAKYSDPMLVGAMKSSMYEYVAEDGDIEVIAQWIKDGAKDDEYFKEEVMYILEEDCQKCHSRNSTMSKAITSIPFSSHEDIIKYTEAGYSWTHMAKNAHIHLFGMSVFLVLVTLAFAFSSYISALKTLLISLSWIALWADISAWWLSKYWDGFAYLIAGAGSVEIGSVIAMSGLCLINMWFKLPSFMLEKDES